MFRNLTTSERDELYKHLAQSMIDLRNEAANLANMSRKSLTAFARLAFWNKRRIALDMRREMADLIHDLYQVSA